MQDKITIADAPDCLNTNDKAMWVLGYEAAIEARGQCLHQIQEPAAAEQAAWHAGLDEGRAQAGFTVSNAETPQAAPAAVAVPMAEAWEQSAVDVEQRTGSVGQDYNQGLAEGMRTCAKDLRAALASTPAADGYTEMLEESFGITDPAAAPVVLPEPEAWIRKTDITELTDCEPETDGWTPLYSESALLATATGLPAQAVLDLEALSMPKNPHPPGTAPGEHAAWACGAGAVFGAVQDAIAATPAGQDLEKLKSLSVTNILLDVVPGYDGMGHEVYATSVQDVVEKLSDLGSRLEDYQLGITAAPQAQADAREAQLLAFAVSEIRRDEMGHAPVLYVSKGQLDNHRDPDGPDSTTHGRYLPARITPAGKFTTPLFAVPHALTPAARDVLAERQRQITQEGYDPQHDDDHVNDEIAAMAALFLMPEGARDWDATSTSYGDTLGEAMLPCDWGMPNFGDDRRRQLVKGTAMGLAEIERIDRAAIAAAKGEQQ